MPDPELVAHLIDLGATVEQTADKDDGDLIGLAGDLQLSRDLSLGLDELSERTGVAAGEISAIYDQLGLKVSGLAGFGEADVDLVNLVGNDPTGIIDEVGPQLLRVTGTLMSRLAEAAVAAYVQDIEGRGDLPDDLIELADQNSLASGLALTLGENLPTVFRHHMWTAVRRQRHAQSDVIAPEVVKAAVGFVDLVGFTSFSARVSPAELIAAIESFERTAFETAQHHGGRVVKSIGDEVMLVAGDAATVAAIALELIDGIGDDPSVAPRGGVSAGDILFRLGDYYGPVVNLAARLAGEAIPGEVLTDLSTLDHSGLVAHPSGKRSLKGFAEPVSVWSVEQVTPR